MKKLLLILNPVSGMRKANRFLADILTELSAQGYECTVQATIPERNAEQIAAELAKDKELVVCIGGDGTLNETVNGCLKTHGKTPPIGYIPAGSTNDFANSLKLPQHPMACLSQILDGEIHAIDVGLFNGKPFVYTASFGAFTKASYSAPREMRNMMGYMAYILEGASEITDICSYELCIEADGETRVGEYIFGGICNSKRIGGGLIQFTDEMVDLNDGMLEVFLVKTPKTPGDFMQLIFDMNAGNYNSKFIEFFSAKSLHIATTDDMDWTLDGEYQAGSREVSIGVISGALNLKY
ncbi:MAG: diacylglycerol kinase family lipid kinase [Bacteroidaceae bacterium]|nr:diacylglycerol kinase family lipid kinase [Bacteroidaceae bacterium]